MRGRKGEKHCRASWFMKILKMLFLPLYVDLIE
jgi:hypothetical protein